jgi:uncharacterized protein
MIREIEYFDRPGPENTTRCLEWLGSLVDRGVRHLVVASTSGATGARTAEIFAGRDINLVVVGHSFGFSGPNVDTFLPEHAERIRQNNGCIFRGTILTHSIETNLAEAYGGSFPTQIIANSLRRFGHGVKVCIEIVMEACDAGLVPEGEEVAAMAGSNEGADTVCLIRSRPSKRFLELAVLEIPAKPRG